MDFVSSARAHRFARSVVVLLAISCEFHTQKFHIFIESFASTHYIIYGWNSTNFTFYAPQSTRIQTLTIANFIAANTIINMFGSKHNIVIPIEKKLKKRSAHKRKTNTQAQTTTVKTKRTARYRKAFNVVVSTLTVSVYMLSHTYIPMVSIRPSGKLNCIL